MEEKDNWGIFKAVCGKIFAVCIYFAGAVLLLSGACFVVVGVNLMPPSNSGYGWIMLTVGISLGGAGFLVIKTMLRKKKKQDVQ